MYYGVVIRDPQIIQTAISEINKEEVKCDQKSYTCKGEGHLGSSIPVSFSAHADGFQQQSI